MPSFSSSFSSFFSSSRRERDIINRYLENAQQCKNGTGKIGSAKMLSKFKKLQLMLLGFGK
jgi:hypothetical protein